jgi:dihydrofolate reductase
MGKIVISENVSLDGVVQDPTGDEGFRHSGWFGQIEDKDREEAAKVLLDEALGTEAMLLGRRSYEFLAARWPSRTGALADRRALIYASASGAITGDAATPGE